LFFVFKPHLLSADKRQASALEDIIELGLMARMNMKGHAALVVVD
jgi:hypothetical protein